MFCLVAFKTQVNDMSKLQEAKLEATRICKLSW